MRNKESRNKKSVGWFIDLYVVSTVKSIQRWNSTVFVTTSHHSDNDPRFFPSLLLFPISGELHFENELRSVCVQRRKFFGKLRFFAEKRFPGTGRTIVGIFLGEKRKRKRREEEEGKEEEEEGEGAVGMLDAFSRGRRRQFRFRRFNLSRIGRRRCVFWELRPGKLSEILYRELISRKYRGGSREASLRGERKLILVFATRILLSKVCKLWLKE